MVGKGLAVSLAIAAMAAAADAQDVVRLRSGKLLSGAVVVDEANKDGFSVTLWDTGGTVFVKWTQVPETEQRRLLNKRASAATAAVGDILDGVRVITSNREVVGVLVSETDQMINIKTAGAASATAIPKGAVLKREDLKIQEIEAYSPDEMLARREAAGLKPLDLGHFAKALKLFARAKDYYTRAAEDPALKDEASKLAAECDAFIREADAEKALNAIRKLQEETKYPEAIEAANKFLAEFADTEIAKQNKDLVKKLEAEKADFEKNRDKILAQKVPDLWRSVRNTLWSKHADRKFKLGEARGAMDRLDEEIAAEVGKKINCTRDEAEKYWGMREQKQQSAGMGTGSWIYLGGQDGGMDYTGSAQQPGGGGGGGDRGKGKGGNQPKPPELGRKLQTSEEWWSTASTTDRLKWLQCYYGLNSGLVKKVKEEDKDCSACGGIGTMKAARGGQIVDVVCPRCHQAKKDKGVIFW